MKKHYIWSIETFEGSSPMKLLEHFKECERDMGEEKGKNVEREDSLSLNNVQQRTVLGPRSSGIHILS